MNAGICVCVLLAALYSSGGLALPTHSLAEGQLDKAVAAHTRHTRSVFPSDQIHFLQDKQEQEKAEQRVNELLAKLISSKVSHRRSTPKSVASPSHRIKDRDYLGWMDFGRRSAEEYEYSS
ncbi:cholecystokinin a [Hoplias malabaricus]|uniref:cholecystokinin a n=1 Tax=Hoplias malabaricus TaxID=27720 RepID=UPI0034631437